MQVSIDSVESRFLSELAQVASVEALEQLKARYLGKSGPISEMFQGLGRVSQEERKVWGPKFNALRQQIQEAVDRRRQELVQEAFLKTSKGQVADLTLPLPTARFEGRHPITQTMEFLVDLLVHMGFDVAEGSEIESEDFNFTFLNMPEHHPARDDHDTFYLTRPWLLRTHTSPVQIHYMRRYSQLPIQMIAPGRVYRADDDATHSPMFHQIEGLWVDRGIHFGHLKGLLRTFLKEVFDIKKVRFRPSFFPFTEPSAEVDIGCVFCDGRGCRVCKMAGWLEVMGSGLVHPKVLHHGGIHDTSVSGLAFGLGVDRIAMLLFRIPHMRMLFDNDPRILSQVSRSRRFPTLS